MTYLEVRAALCEMYPGWTFDTIDDMSFEQISSALSRGDAATGIPVYSAGEALEVAANWRVYLGI
jgi:hypothetical protein